jgi:preprotein translocase subunit SecA
MLQAPPTPPQVGQKRWLMAIQEGLLKWALLDARSFREQLLQLRGQLAMRGFKPDLLAEAMAAVGVVLQRHKGWAVHDVQWLAARWMLDGRLVEMATGEGKSVVVALAATVAALAHVPVHAMTANDYLARRDLDAWLPLYDALGLSAACVLAPMKAPERRAAYACDIVHVTAREVAFDHLRDQAALASHAQDQVVLRGLCLAILDEADSILIDEACTPLVLSQAVEPAGRDRPQRVAMFLAQQLIGGHHHAEQADRSVLLTSQGRARLAQLTQHHEGPWRLARYRDEQVQLALTALHSLQRDVDYLVQDDEVVIVDGVTGRQAVGRVWSRGLHHMVCIKEKLPLPPDTETLTQTTYQAFFPRYHRLCGLSGTLWEERAELMALYGLPVWRAPLRQPSRRIDLGWHLVASESALHQQVLQEACERAAAGQAVLIGTDSVQASEALSTLLQARGTLHTVLNARIDSEEGERERALIADAGRPGAITIATHMAGRGTDIHLHEDTLRHGGLHVINTRLNASGRIDRQLIGRAARQGQPGTCSTWLQLDDPTLVNRLGRARQALWGLTHWPRLLRAVCQWVQAREGRQAATQRWLQLQQGQSLRRQLRWSGKDDWL